MSLGNEDFIMPGKPLQHERLKLQLIATVRILKKKQQQLQADQDLLNDRWTDALAAKEYGLKCIAKSYPKRKFLPQFDDEAPEPAPASRNVVDRPPCGRDKMVTRAKNQTVLPRRKGRDKTAGAIHMTFVKTWTVEQDIQDRPTDREDVP